MPKPASRFDLRLPNNPKPRPGKRIGALAAGTKQGFALELALSSPALSEQNIPPWAQLKSPAGLAVNPAPEAGADAAYFCAGASLALFDARLKESSHFAGVARQRLALRAAVACAERSCLKEDAAALRDVIHFLKPGADPGPAGRLHQLWRFLASQPARINPKHLHAAADLLGLPVKKTSGADEIGRLVTVLEKINITIRNPIAAAGQGAVSARQIFAAVPGVDSEILALWIADLVLAVKLGWEKPVPLLAIGIEDPALRGAFGNQLGFENPKTWGRWCTFAYALAFEEAHELTKQLAPCCESLLRTAAKLRAKEADRVIEMLLNDDALSPSEATHATQLSDRASRRLFERLTTLGALREFTGRANFRLYGL
jgi:hypothetical protein